MLEDSEANHFSSWNDDPALTKDRRKSFRVADDFLAGFAAAATATAASSVVIITVEMATNLSNKDFVGKTVRATEW